jgi:sirohydrochlorin cobaltochelatase
MAGKSVSGRALILFAHGARDPRWAEPLTRIQQLVTLRSDGSLPVYQAFLELMSPTLPELVAKLSADQFTHLHIVPIFLGQGGHVRNDLPKLIQQLELTYPLVSFHLANAIGEDEQVLNAIADVCIANLTNPIPPEA